MSNHISIQDKLFERILQKFNKKTDAVETIQKLLSIGRDSTYRRLRGETLLSSKEMRILALHFNISLDELAFQDANIVFVSYNVFESETQNFMEFTSKLNILLKQVNSVENIEIINASDEMPIFQLMRFKELFAFKLYVWGVNTWQFEHLQNIPFKTSLVSPDVFKVAKENVKLYDSIDTTELWDLGVMDKTLNQIESCVLVGQFEDPKIALKLCDQLMQLFKHLKKVAEVGAKFPLEKTSAKVKSKIKRRSKGKFNLFYNEMSSTGNTFLVKSEQTKFMITAFCAPNFFRSQDERLCNYTEDWLQNIISRSTPMSGRGGRNRDMYFRRLENKITYMRNRISMIIEGEASI